jgi:hypothetical protein
MYTNAGYLSDASSPPVFRQISPERAAPIIEWAVRLALRELFPVVRVEHVKILPCISGCRAEIICRCALRGSELDVEQPGAIAGHVESQIAVALADRFGASAVERLVVTLAAPDDLICSGVFLACDGLETPA